MREIFGEDYEDMKKNQEEKPKEIVPEENEEASKEITALEKAPMEIMEEKAEPNPEASISLVAEEVTFDELTEVEEGKQPEQEVEEKIESKPKTQKEIENEQETLRSSHG